MLLVVGKDEGASGLGCVEGWVVCARGVAVNGVEGLGLGVEDCVLACSCVAWSRAVWCRQARCGRGIAAGVMEDGAVHRSSEVKLRSIERENILA